ncbi:MAG: hypothetical protein ABI615_08475 [Chthoniobacterales bacterium]
MNIKFNTLLFTLLTSSLFAASPVKNGDFTDAGNNWSGAGKIVTVNDAGESVMLNGTPAMELTAQKDSFVSCDQSIRLNKGITKVVITVEAKALPDFKANKESRKYSNFGPGWWQWSGLIFPKADFCIRLQDGWYYYRAVNFAPSNNWQTITTTIGKLNPQAYKKLSLVICPGEGNVLIRSVKVEESAN